MGKDSKIFYTPKNNLNMHYLVIIEYFLILNPERLWGSICTLQEA